MTFSRKLASEFIGTAGLLTIVVGSGIMGERLANGNAAVALLGNSIATGAGLVILIYGFGNISGAHFNPAVTLTAWAAGNIGASFGVAYVLVQIAGAIAGVAIANMMFELPAVNMSTKLREGPAQFLGEFVATFGLIGVIRLGSKFHPTLVGLMVACYITAAYWFTSSTSFANPAVTIARSLSNTFAGIAASSVPMFIAAQLSGAIVAMLVFRWLLAEGNVDERKA
ncbi:MAG: MIP/aquaporin family protein [Pyrinomonadaceae bacterium]